ncbi:MAG: CNNM domain-containing protein [Phycisphaerales bacterium JB054]
MTLLIVTVAAVLLISGLCSLTEAALYSVRVSYVRNLADSGSRAGKILSAFKAGMERPIAAILIVNTVANTAGATIAGALAEKELGHGALIWFSAVFTLCVLVLAEILPKIAGVAFSQGVTRTVAVGLQAVVFVLGPLVWLVQTVSKTVLPTAHIAIAPEDEVRHMARMSAEEGSILPIEAELVQNVLKLNDLLAKQIMTPRAVVSELRANMTLREVEERERDWTHARLPVYAEGDSERWAGVVLRRDILAALARGERDRLVGSMCQPLHFVPSNTRGHLLLRQFVAMRTHLFGVVNEHGVVVGVVTLEDVMESLIGEEIVDEMDVVVDMQQYARERPGQQGLREEPPPESEEEPGALGGD